MQREESLLIPFLALIIALVFAVGSVAWNLINPPPMTGTITGKNHHPAYYPADAKTPEVFVLAITDPAGKCCSSWVVSEDRWGLYEVGDTVEWWPRFVKGDF